MKFIVAGLLVVFCTILTGMILQRGLTTRPEANGRPTKTRIVTEIKSLPPPGFAALPQSGGWVAKRYLPHSNRRRKRNGDTRKKSYVCFSWRRSSVSRVRLWAGTSC